MNLKKRIVNIRVMFSVFVGLIVGILFSHFFLLTNMSKTLLITLSVVFIIICIAAIIYGALTHKYNSQTKYRENVSILLILSSIGYIIFFFVGILISLLPIFKIANVKSFSEEVTVSGVVCDYIEDNSTYKKFIIKDCEIISENKNYSTDFKVIVYTSKYLDINLGNKIIFVGEIDNYLADKDYDFSLLVQDIGYSTYVSSSDIIIDDGTAELKDIIKNKTYEILNRNLNSDNAKITYAILFGEKQGISENITQMFSYAGISHILAVSGLHIGVLVSLIYYLLKKLKIKKIIRFILLFITLLFYCYLCSFSPSVCRASIMALLSCLCHVFQVEYDALAGLSIAGILILLFDPLSLFTISFQLSFLCIFSIISLAPAITKLLKKIKIPKTLTSAVAISISTNLVILPVCVNYFESISLVGIFANILVLPIFSVTYVLLFSLTLLSFIFNSLGVLLFIPNLFLHLIKVIADLSSYISFLSFKTFNVGYIVLLLTILTCLILHFLMINKRIRSVIVLLMTCVILGIFISYNIPTKYTDSNIIINYQTNTNVVFYIKDNEVTLIGSDITESQLNRQMKSMKINTLKYIVAYDFQLNEIDELMQICVNNKIEKVYLPKEYNYPQIIDKIENVEFIDEKVIFEDMELSLIEYMNETIAINLVLNDKESLLIPMMDINKTEGLYLANQYSGVDYLFVNKINTEIINFEILNPNQIICQKYSNSYQKNIVSLKLCDKIKITI